MSFYIKRLRIILLMVIMISVVGCVAHIDERVRKIQIGATQAEVVAALGRPDHMMERSGGMNNSYIYRDNAVIFINGRVNWIGKARMFDNSLLARMSYDKAFKYHRIIELEKEDESKMSVKWIQPKNKLNPCKIYTGYYPEEEDRTKRSDYRLYWDGDCKDGYAYGLGREFEFYGDVERNDMAEYKGSGVEPVYYRTSYGEGREGSVQEAVKGSAIKFDHDQYGEITSIIIGDEPHYTRTSNMVKMGAGDDHVLYSKIIGKNAIEIRMYDCNDMAPNNRYVMNLFKEDATRYGYKGAVDYNGEYIMDIDTLKEEEYKLLPNSYYSYHLDLIREIKRSFKKAVRYRGDYLSVINRYRSRICNDEVQVDFMDGEVYKNICSTRYDDQINQLINEIQLKERNSESSFLAKKKSNNNLCVNEEKMPDSSSGKTSRAKEPAKSSDHNSKPSLHSTGSGFFVDHKGSVLTNNHVVDNCKIIKVNGSDVNLKSQDQSNDLALLQGKGSPEQAHFRSGRGVRLGESVIAAGYPLRGMLGDGLNVTTGIVSSLSGLSNDSGKLQISTPVNGGNSGGPLLDEAGNVVGVIVSKLDAINAAVVTGELVQGVNFAIKGNVARTFLEMNEVDYQVRSSEANKSTANIADEAGKYTALVECWK